MCVFFFGPSMRVNIDGVLFNKVCLYFEKIDFNVFSSWFMPWNVTSILSWSLLIQEQVSFWQKPGLLCTKRISRSSTYKILNRMSTVTLNCYDLFIFVSIIMIHFFSLSTSHFIHLYLTGVILLKLLAFVVYQTWHSIINAKIRVCHVKYTRKKAKSG